MRASCGSSTFGPACCTPQHFERLKPEYKALKGDQAEVETASGTLSRLRVAASLSLSRLVQGTVLECAVVQSRPLREKPEAGTAGTERCICEHYLAPCDHRELKLEPMTLASQTWYRFPAKATHSSCQP
eukprot:3972742-Amphidinium_carterae.1